MSEFVKLDERRISGKGVLKVPPTALKYRYYVMFVDLLRRPRNQYVSREWNPDKSLYARMVFRRDQYVLFDGKIEYARQQFTYVNDIAGQTLLAVKCAYEGTLQSFANLVGGLAGTPGGVGIFVESIENKIQDFRNLAIGWDEVLFKCYSDSALLVRFYGADYYKCNPLEETSDYPPPPPPPPPPVPPGTPLDGISPPYDDESGDDGNSEPFPGDEAGYDFPFGDECELYDVSILVYDNVQMFDITENYTIYAPIGEPFLGEKDGLFGIIIECRGVIQGGSCIPLQELLFLNSTFPQYENLRLLSITPHEE